ncbi:hypothetical protein CYMTET_44643 [Cymbomonas tetramitiformis]|uniref:Protein kinase domain-containing protein n=1 Tax=Cymbomonas tetramitiformis TaxID=36881 RepID=A0AAE0BZU9_9CHLO|nr:hypothetical protein CYMTET_44643 [Cymbomonas tetramitiformis]|eukprot:gene13070-15438_t
MEERLVAPFRVVKHWFSKRTDADASTIASRILDYHSCRLEGTDGGHRDLNLYKNRIFEKMNFSCVRVIKSSQAGRGQMKAVYSGYAHDFSHAKKKAILKVSGVSQSSIYAIKSMQHLKGEGIGCINECLWYQQLGEEFADSENGCVPQLLDVRVIRQPESRRGSKHDFVFICLLISECEVTLHDWLRPNAHLSSMPDEAGSIDLQWGAGYSSLQHPQLRDGANAILRRLILHLVLILHSLQCKHCMVHHDLHTNNILLRQHHSDGVVPVLSDFESMEGFVYCEDRKNAESPEYVCGIQVYSYVNGMTLSYDCYRSLSDLLHVLHTYNLQGFVDADTMNFLLGAVDRYFCTERSIRERCGSVDDQRKYYTRVWQPHIITALCDPVELLTWNEYLFNSLKGALWTSTECLQALQMNHPRDAVKCELSRHARTFRRLFVSGSELTWECAASEFKLFLPSDFFEVVHNLDDACKLLRSTIYAMVHRSWDECRSDVSNCVRWNLMDSTSGKGNFLFARLCIIQAVVLSVYMWLYDEVCAQRAQRSASASFWDQSKIRVSEEGMVNALACFLGNIVPTTHVIKLLGDIGCPHSISDLYNINSVIKTSLESRVRGGFMRCLPVPCFSVLPVERFDIRSTSMLMDLAKLSMDPRVYMTDNTIQFLPEYREICSSRARQIQSREPDNSKQRFT